MPLPERKILLHAAPGAESGLMLIELMMALALLGLVLAAIYLFYFYAYDSISWATANSRVLQDARMAIAQISDDVRNAEKPLDGSGKPPVYFPDTNGKELYIYCVENSKEISKHILVKYRVDDNGILERGAEEYDALTNSYPPVSSLSRYPDSSSTMQITNGSTPVFSAKLSDPLLVQVDLLVNDAQVPLARSLEVKTDISVRSTGHH